MANIILYEDIITREHRALNRGILLQLLENNDAIEIYVQGCNVTNTSSYIDFAYNGAYEDLYGKAYGLVADDNNEYLFFIDRIEPCNFNDESNKYYRIYFTIDWWSTILYRQDDEFMSKNVIDYIEGNVERAHVNDVYKQDVEGVFFPTIMYTSDVPEEDITHTYNDGFLLNGDLEFNSDNDEILWHYVLFNFSDTSPTEIFTNVMTGTRRVFRHYCPAPCGIAFMPVKNGVSLDTNINYYDGTDYGVYSFNGGYPMSTLTDPRIIHSFLSPIPPAEYIYNPTSGEVTIIGWKRNHSHEDVDRIAQSSIGYVTLTGPSIFANEAIPMLPFAEGINMRIIDWVLSDDYQLPIKIIDANSGVNKPSNYDEYHKLAIKARSEAYNLCGIFCNGEFYKMPISFTQSFRCGIDYENGGVFVDVTKTNSRSGVDMFHRVGLDSTFSPYKIVDRLKIFQGVLGGATSAAGSVFSGYGGKKANTANIIGGYISGVGGGVNTMLDMIANSRGVISSQPSGQAQENGVGLAQFIAMQPVNLQVICDKLEAFGYNTPLRVDVILQKHLRKYYNYVKMNNCLFANTKFPTEVRLSIQEMFNNGVWLWSNANPTQEDCRDGESRENSIGYMWLNNYPSLMDD